MYESSDYQGCLNFLDTNLKDIMDVQRYMEMRVDCYIKLGQVQEAIEALDHLIDVNPDNQDYYRKVLKVKGIETSDQDLYSVKDN